MQINELSTGNFLKIILVIQILLFFLIGLDIIGLHIPILRQLIGFIYLISVPGLLLLRILGLKRLGNIHTILYSVGLSITTLMFTGFLMNTIYPSVGILKPISLFPLLITISIIVLILCLLNYMREKSFYNLTQKKEILNKNLIKKGEISQFRQLYGVIKDISRPSIIFLCIIPFIAILGTYMVNTYQNNILLMLLIIIIAMTVILVSFDKISKNLYPFVIFILALSLLYHTSLISMNLIGWDIHMEYYVSNLVVTNSYWDPSIPTEYNAMLSLTMLAPVFSTICGMDLTSVFKIIYPFIFSLVPLGLYTIFKNQTNNKKIAFLSCFLFISLFTFYNELIALARQEIGELFLILMLLLFIDTKVNLTKKSILFTLFIFSIIVSHYALSYIYIFYVIMAWLILFLIDNLKIGNLTDKLDINNLLSSNLSNFKNIMNLNENKLINLNFILLFIISAATWYVFISDSHTLYVFTKIFGNIIGNITDLFSSKGGAGLDTIVKGGTQSILHQTSKYIHLLSQFFILIGIVGLLRIKLNFKREYFIFVIISILMLVSSIAVPFFGASLNTTRIYQITLIFLAPFCIVGSIIFFDIINRSIKFIIKNIIYFNKNRNFTESKSQSKYINENNEGYFKIPHMLVKKMPKIIKSKKIDFISDIFQLLINYFFGISWKNKNIEKYLKITSIVLVIYLLFNSGFIYEITNDQYTSFSLSQGSINNINDKVSIYTVLNTYKQDKYSVQWFDSNVKRSGDTRIYADLISRQPLMESGVGITYGYRIPLINSTISQISHGSFIFLGYVNIRKNLAVTSALGGSTSDLSSILTNSSKIYSNGGGDIYLVNGLSRG